MEMVEAVKVRSGSYEKDLMGIWRRAINKNREKEEEMKSRESGKIGSNKNLMFLSSEIFKKQRIAEEKINKEVNIMMRELE